MVQQSPGPRRCVPASVGSDDHLPPFRRRTLERPVPLAANLDAESEEGVAGQRLREAIRERDTTRPARCGTAASAFAAGRSSAGTGPRRASRRPGSWLRGAYRPLKSPACPRGHAREETRKLAAPLTANFPTSSSAGRYLLVPANVASIERVGPAGSGTVKRPSRVGDRGRSARGTAHHCRSGPRPRSVDPPRACRRRREAGRAPPTWSRTARSGRSTRRHPELVLSSTAERSGKLSRIGEPSSRSVVS